MSKILVLGAGAFQVPAFSKLQNAGYTVLAADRNPEAPGRGMADLFQPIDIADVDCLLAWAREEKIDGVMPLNDFATPAAAAIAETLGLPGNSRQCAGLANDKGLMRDRWAGLPIPTYKVVANAADIVGACGEIGFPCVVKPALSGGGGRGISVVRRPDDAAWAADFAAPFARNGRYVIERFIDGLELTVEAASIAGRHTILAISDKIKPPLRTRVATSLNYSADIPEAAAEEVARCVASALDALDFQYGISHTEVILEDLTGRPVLVETGARPGGGHIFHTLIEAVSGINGPALNAAILTGGTEEIGSPLRRGGVYRFFSAPQGTLVRVEHLEQARALPGVLDIGITARPGQTVGELKNSFDRPGFVVTSASDRRSAVEIADQAETLIKFIVET